MVDEIVSHQSAISSVEDLVTYCPRLIQYLQDAPYFEGAIGADELTKRLRLFVQRIRSFLADFKNEASPPYVERQLSIRVQFDEPGSISSPVHGQPEAVISQLEEVLRLERIWSQVERLLPIFEETRAWMLRSADLHHDDMDRMMRYQTSLERRLSTAIGELLELQRHRLKQDR